MATFTDAKAVFFDVDDTLYDFAESMRHAFVHLHRVYPEAFAGADPTRIETAYWRHSDALPDATKLDLLVNDPDLYRRTMWAGTLRELGLHLDPRAEEWLRRAHPDVPARWDDPEGFARVIAEEFQKYRPDHWRAAAFEGAWDLLRDLRKRGKTVGAITNGPPQVQRPKLEAFRYLDFFPEPLVFVSGEFGARKPDASIFLAAAKAAGVPPSDCVMVGDAREYDMPAKAVGFRTILFDGKAKRPDCASDPWPPDAVAGTYAELRGLLLGE
jgi:putative hydrolase of the HAD superfamily